ncbi:hypothetical protein TruAng_012332 [Truncatella angustata]|nr:hypothetical protein TruAng_012332 [Truncatella angustata]
MGGSRGVLFKVGLMAYGYTFVAKGTVSAFIRDQEHETTIYKHLEGLQGSQVPVCLGAIDLRDMGRIYYYDHRVYIEYLLLLSYGSPINEAVRAGELMLIDFERSVVKAGRKPLGNIVLNKRSWNGQRKGITAPMYSYAPGDASYEENILRAGVEFPEKDVFAVPAACACKPRGDAKIGMSKQHRLIVCFKKNARRRREERQGETSKETGGMTGSIGQTVTGSSDGKTAVRTVSTLGDPRQAPRGPEDDPAGKCLLPAPEVSGPVQHTFLDIFHDNSLTSFFLFSSPSRVSAVQPPPGSPRDYT